jgi:hypothetical protein
MSAVAWADPSIDAPTSLECAEDRFGVWLAQPGRGIEIERPDGRIFQAIAYERDGLYRRQLVLKANGDTQVLAIEELALLGAQERYW